MKRLIVINGPAGVGKSTVGNLIHDEQKPSYLLDGDDIRRYLNNYHEFPREGRTLRNKQIISMLDVLLAEDLTVVLVMLHTDNVMLDKYVNLGIKHGAEINEVFLWVQNKETLLDRFSKRDSGPTRHPNSVLTSERVAEYWDTMKHFTITRNVNSTINTEGLTPKDVASLVLKNKK